MRIRDADCQGMLFVRFLDFWGHANHRGRLRRANSGKTSLPFLSTNSGWRKPLTRVNGNPSTTRSVYYSSIDRVAEITGPQGLGTSKDSDARDYFSNMKKHTIAFSTTQEGDKELIELAFSKSKADDRKEWLRQFKVFRLRCYHIRYSLCATSQEPTSTTIQMRFLTPTSSTRSLSSSRLRTTFVPSRPCVTVSSPVRGRSSGVVSKGNSRRKSRYGVLGG